MSSSETPTILSRPMWRRTVAAIIAVQAAMHIWVLTGRSFYWDDFIIVGGSVDNPWWSPSFWAQAHDGHFAPLSFLLQRGVNALAPWQWWLPALLMLLGSVAVTALLARAVRALAGQTWIAVAAVGLVAWTPLTLPATTWWSAAVNSLPMQLALAWWVIVANTSFTVRRAIGANIALIVALGFFEKSIAIVPLVFAITVASAYARRSRFTFRPLLWIPGFVITVLWTILYVVLASGTARETADTPRIELFRGGLEQVMAALVGGPWFWERWAPGQAWANAPFGLVVVGGGVVTLFVLFALVRDRRSWLPVTIGLSYLFVVLIVMTVVRSGEHTADELAKTLHYYADSAMVLGLTAAVAWTRPLSTWQVTPVLMVLLAISSGVSAAGYRAAWSDDVVPAWLETTKNSLHDAPDNSPILNQGAPLEVLLPIANPRHTYHYVFNDVRDRPEFGRYTDRPQMFDVSGEIIPAEVLGAARLEPDDSPGCGSRLDIGPEGNGVMDVAIDDIITISDWTVEFNALASEDMDVRLALPNPFQTTEETYDSSTLVPVGTDLERRWVTVDGGGNILRVVVVGATPGEYLCVGAGAIGPLVPAS